MSKINHFKYFKTSPEIIKLAVMYYVRYPLSLRNVEDILHERGIDICHETIRYWWNKFGTLFSKEVKKKTKHHASNWRWHIDEVFVKINGELHYLWRAIDHEGTVLDCYVSKRRDRKTAKKVLKKLISKHGLPREIVTEKIMNKFRSMGSLQKFVAIQSTFLNHFNHQRHLETRDTFKNLRQSSLNAWNEVLVA